MKRYLPPDLVYPPALDPTFHPRGIAQRRALLINPFYPKDPHASFGKHVLTPSLALTSIAASTPESWEVSYWDENLLQGPPPCEPFPRVVGMTRASWCWTGRVEPFAIIDLPNCRHY